MITWPALPGWAVSTVQAGQLPWTRDHEHTGRLFATVTLSCLAKQCLLSHRKALKLYACWLFVERRKGELFYHCISKALLHCWLPNKKCLHIQYSECSFLKLVIFFLDCKAKCFSESLECVHFFFNLIFITGFKLQGKKQIKEFNVVKRLAGILESFFLNIFLILKTPNRQLNMVGH